MPPVDLQAGLGPILQRIFIANPQARADIIKNLQVLMGDKAQLILPSVTQTPEGLAGRLPPDVPAEIDLPQEGFVGTPSGLVDQPIVTPESTFESPQEGFSATPEGLVPSISTSDILDIGKDFRPGGIEEDGVVVDNPDGGKARIDFPFGVPKDPFRKSANPEKATRVETRLVKLDKLKGVGFGNKIDEGKVKSLVEDMKSKGFTGGSGQRIIIEVTPDGNVQAGEGNHRLAAARQAGLDKVDVEIRYKGNADLVEGIWSP